MVIAKKKVKAQMNNTIKSMDYNWASGLEGPNNQEGVPRAIFIPHSNSLPFEERRVTLEQPVKIGRNVYRATPSSTNTIFECRVLSRHHATLYYDKGHFYLVDNQSSNGTFINNNRCSISKEQEPHEVFSGDVVQFGIPVVENAVNSEKNTFPPVVALLKLYHPDGKEAKLTFNPTMTTPLHLKELYQLNNYVQEAIQREASLESRLRTLRECVEKTRAEARESWELFVGEQRLLMRVHTLETMHSMGKQPDPHQLAQLLNDKKNYQEVAQESLRAAHEQRLHLEETLERRNREAVALQQHNCALRLAANNALQELQKLAARCERKMCAARLAIATAEEREQTVRGQLPLAYSVQNGESKMLVLCTDSNKVQEAKRGGSLEEAIRALPDYIKLLLPAHVLTKAGMNVVSAEPKTAKDIIILKKNDGTFRAKSEVGSSGSSEEKTGDPDTCTDDEKQSRLNHDSETEEPASLDGDIHADNNANSTFSEPEREDSPSACGVEYANVLRVMSGLNDEIKALRERLAAASAENDQLRCVRDELLAVHAEQRDETDDGPAEFRARIADLQTQLTRSTAAEESNLVEIQRLTTSAAQLQAELQFRPTRADVDDLAAVVGDLRRELIDKNIQIQKLHEQLYKQIHTTETATETTRSLEDLTMHNDWSKDALDPSKISEELDDLFRLDSEDDEDTDSAVTEITKENTDDTIENVEENRSEVTEPKALVRLCEEERIQMTMQNGSLHALEEELVRAKERWAEVSEERARLAAQLREIQNKPFAVSVARVLLVVVPVLAACVCYVIFPHLS